MGRGQFDDSAARESWQMWEVEGFLSFSSRPPSRFCSPSPHCLFVAMVQICRKWRLLSSSTDMMLRASDSLQVTATWSICEQLLQRLQAAGWNPLNRHLPNITANINTAHPHHGLRIWTVHANACTRGDAITVPTAHLFYGSPLHQGLCTWYGGRRGMMMGYLSDWISGFKLRSDLWTVAHQGWSGRSKLCSDVDEWQWHYQKRHV